MTCNEFKAAVTRNPAWASTLTETVVITDYCDMRKSRITRLSPLLHFAGADEFGNSADFGMCKTLEVAEGFFEKGVIFDKSGIVRIRNLTIRRANDNGQAASFVGCKNLKIATGAYIGYVSFFGSGIESIENLHIMYPDLRGNAADFGECKSLIVACGNFPGHVNFKWSGVERIEAHHRWLYREYKDLQAAFPDPYEVSRDKLTFLDWCRTEGRIRFPQFFSKDGGSAAFSPGPSHSAIPPGMALRLFLMMLSPTNGRALRGRMTRMLKREGIGGIARRLRRGKAA